MIGTRGKPDELTTKIGREEELKLDPTIFRLVCESFDYELKIELFASSKHHQLRRYYTVDTEHFA